MTASTTKKFLKENGIDIDAMLVRIGNQLSETSKAFGGIGVPKSHIPIIAKQELERLSESLESEVHDEV